MRPAALIVTLAVLALGPATAARDGNRAERDAQQLAQALAGRSAGAAQRCLSSNYTDGPQIVGQTLLYRDARTIWRSDIPDCPTLSDDPILLVEIYGGQICDSDRFRTLPRGGIAIPGPSCRFGQFVPYRKPR